MNYFAETVENEGKMMQKNSPARFCKNNFLHDKNLVSFNFNTQILTQ